jgi:hypothetical protein
MRCNLPVVELVDRDAKAVNLRQRHFALVESIRDVLGSSKQPILITICAQQAFLKRRCRFAVDASETARRTANQKAIRTEHCAFGVDTYPSVCRTTRVQPPHITKHPN